MSFTKEDRITLLREMGLDVDNLYAMEVENGMPVMKKIEVDGVDNDANDVPIADDDTAKAIMDGTPVYNAEFHRQWVYAQMVHNLEDSGHYKDFNAFLEDRYRWTYQLTMMEDEINTLAHMQKDGDERFNMRWLFFQPWMVADIYNDLYEQVRTVFEWARKSSYRKCNDSPYVKVGTELVFSDSIPERLKPLKKAVNKMITMTQETNTLDVCKCFDYEALLKEMKKFNCKLPYGYDWANFSTWYADCIGYDRRKLSRKWIDRFKAAGAFYTMQNAILFHGAKYQGFKGDEAYHAMCENTRSYASVNPADGRDAYLGWRTFGEMRECIKVNKITAANMY